MASMHLDDDRFQWHRAVERRWRQPPMWAAYAALLRDTFGQPFETPMTDFTHLRQTGTVAEFNTRFDQLSAKLDLTEAYLVDAYVGALKDEIADSVRLFNPHTLQEARRLARTQEIAVNRRAAKTSGDKFQRQGSTVSGSKQTADALINPKITSFGSGYVRNDRAAPPYNQNYRTDIAGNGKTNTSGFSQRSITRPVKALTAEEEAEHRANNLCFFCHGKFSRDHKCPQRQKMQLHLVLLEEEEPWDRENTTEMVGSEPEAETEQMGISLHAINGSDKSDAMRVPGSAGKHQLQILIDSGSTHDFLNLSTALKLGWQAQDMPSACVEIAGGGKLKVHGVWHGFRWKMQGLNFTFDVWIIELHTYDMVLGLRWLKSIKSAFWDFESLSMCFWKDGQQVRLQANVPHPLKIVAPKRVVTSRMKEEQLFLLQLVMVGGDRMSCCAITAAASELPAAIQEVLESFREIFGEPRGLPPFRPGHNHPIVLEEGTNPISLKPYRYPTAQKDVIEKLVAKLLEVGVVQESCSPFSAPIVLVKKKDGSWRMCVDYRELNKKTVKNQYPIPLVEDLFDELSKARWFTKLDLRAGYHQIRMVP